jgi:hypothetical protein
MQLTSPSFAATLALGWLLSSRPSGCESIQEAIEPPSTPVTLAVMGDCPYGADQLEDFPELVAHINADPDVDRVVHLGDIGKGSDICTERYYSQIAAHFGAFDDPLVYTPGDNEWADCHRADRGKHHPLERLAALRSVFFSTPNATLGGKQELLFTQANAAQFRDWPENQAWIQSGVVFATLHVVGAKNGLSKWFDDDTTDNLEDDRQAREAEVSARSKAVIAWTESTFELARITRAKGVLLLMQADTWAHGGEDGYGEILRVIAERALAYGGPVLLLQGDSHDYLADRPFAEGDPRHDIDVAVPLLTRVVVQGETISEWLKVTVDPSTKTVFSWTRVER